MASITEKTIIHAPIDQVFASWHDEYADIYKFNPVIGKSFLLKETQVNKGLGALRQCNFVDGKNWIRERVSEFTENKRIVVDIYEGTVPIKNGKATISFKDLGGGKTELTMTVSFEPKIPLIGALMVPVMKKQFGANIRSLVAANARYVERGEQVRPTLAAA